MEKDEMKMSLGRFIATRRKRMSLTQEELAATLNVSKSAIAKWETDGGIPDRDNLYKLAETMGYLSMICIRLYAVRIIKMQILW